MEITDKLFSGWKIWLISADCFQNHFYRINMEEMKKFAMKNEKCIKHFIFWGKWGTRRWWRGCNKKISYAYFIGIDQKREGAVHELDLEKITGKVSWTFRFRDS